MSIIQEIQQHKFHVVSCLLYVYLYIVSLGLSEICLIDTIKDVESYHWNIITSIFSVEIYRPRYRLYKNATNKRYEIILPVFFYVFLNDEIVPNDKTMKLFDYNIQFYFRSHSTTYFFQGILSLCVQSLFFLHLSIIYKRRVQRFDAFEDD